MSCVSVRKEFMKPFRSLKKHSRLGSWAILASYVTQIIASGVAGYLLLNTHNSIAYLGVGILVLFIGTRFRGINNIVHECSHFPFTQERPDNVVIGSLASALLLSSFDVYLKEHMTHHAHLGDYEKDLDFKNIQDFGFEKELSWATIARHIMTPFVGLHLPKYLSVNLSVRDGFGYALLKMALILATLGFAYFDTVAALVLIVMPFAWVYSATNYWTDCIDHGGLIGSGDELKSSRNLIVPRPLRVVIFPRNDCFHLIHHLFPTVPVQHFDDCHMTLLKHQDYRVANGV